MENRSKAFSVAIGSVFVFVLAASSVRADSVHAGRFLEDLERDRQSRLFRLDFVQLGHWGYLNHLHSDNGRHLGFWNGNRWRHWDLNLGNDGPALDSGVANLERSSELSLVTNGAVAQTPEPATMVLLGSGLVALGAYVRRRYHP